MHKVILFLAAAGVCLAAPEIVGGPFVVNTTSNSATLVWIVKSDESTLRTAGGSPKTASALRVEKTTYTGLRPNTHYDYDVNGQDSGKGSFVTAPSGASPFKFVVFGDTRTRNDVHRHVMEALVKHGIPDFVVHTGDLVANGNDTAMWPVFFDIERELLRHTSFFPSLGNHERNSREFYDFFQVTTPYYSFNWGNAHFSVLNSDIGNAASSARARETFWAEQTRWLEEDLAGAQKADFRFVVAHHPPMTAVANRQEDNPHMKAVVPMLEKYHVTAGFFGHDHNYQHYLKDGLHYFITGGGGAPLYDVDKPAPGITVKVVSVENFVTVAVDGKTAKVEAIAIDGKKLDEVELHGASFVP